ncbi:MAG: hypothetical protein N2383_10275 [Caldilineales bacterium]|nr:hypothetical protein [Caldilineales bacterium]
METRDRNIDFISDLTPLTLKIPWLYTVVGVVGLLLGGLIVVVTITSGDIQLPPLIGGALFGLGGLYLVCAGSTTVHIEGQTIRTKGLCRKPRQIDVSQISRIEHSALFARLTLFGSPTAPPVHLDYQLSGFELLVTWLWARRPDLWVEARHQRVFRRTPWLWLLLGGVAVLSISVGLFSISDALWVRLFLVGLGLLMVLTLLLQPIALLVESDGFTLKGPLRQEHVPYRDITDLGLVASNGFPTIYLKLSNRKDMQLGGFRDCLSLYIALLERLLAEREKGASF